MTLREEALTEMLAALLAKLQAQGCDYLCVLRYPDGTCRELAAAHPDARRALLAALTDPPA